MSRSQHDRVAARERGQRRVSLVTRCTAAVGAALAAVFGVVFAQHAAAGAPASSAPPAITRAPNTTVTPHPTITSPPVTQAPVTTPPAPTLQAPAQPPFVVSGGGSHASSGGS
ncbi:MAG: hypothetical protein ACRDRN_28805 [Sciscionella sp.]